MKKLIGVISCILFMTSCSQTGPELHDNQGKTVTLKSLHGNWVLVNYWASWCASCIYEIPEMNRFYQENKDKNIKMFAVSYDEPVNGLDAALKKADIKFPALVENPATAWNLAGLEVVPTTFVLNPNGKVVKVISGPSTAESLHDVIQELQANEKS